ncbi:MAG: hypothetical protein WBF75_07730 [Pseudonocardiaceae bacterium]
MTTDAAAAPRIGIVLFDGFTARDGVGFYEVLSRLRLAVPSSRVRPQLSAVADEIDHGSGGRQFCLTPVPRRRIAPPRWRPECHPQSGSWQ